MIELIHLNKRYGSFQAVNDLNLKVPKGELFGFIGPNGAGKTTTIKMIGGIIQPSSGSVKICGIDMQQFPEAAKSKIGFIPDRPYIYEKLTGREFLQFTADVFGIRDAAFFPKARHWLEIFSLEQWADERIECYSHGMKQRLIMASALLHDPEVMVVDEPMVGLDPVAVKMVKGLFRQLSTSGVTVFMSTHTLSVAEDVCDRIGVVRSGRLIASGTVQELEQQAHADAGLEEAFIRLTREEPS